MGWQRGGVVLLLASLSLAGPGTAAGGGPPSRAEYVGRVEPICKRHSDANGRILDGVRGQVRRGELPPAGRRLIGASRLFGKTVGQIEAVPRPAADGRRLRRWLGFLRTFKEDLRKAGVALKKGNKVRANHEAIRAERVGNAANNVGFVFEFRHCRFDSSGLG
jgi:hypothetical protein